MKSIYSNQVFQPKKLLFLMSICIIICSAKVLAGPYQLSYGNITLTLPSPIGKLIAVNQQMTARLDPATGDLQFQVSVNDFNFVTPNYPEHINASTTTRFQEYYMDNRHFPNAQFKGALVSLKKVDFTKEGVYAVGIKGKITVRGVSQDIAPEATIEVKNGHLYVRSSFVLRVTDYKVPVPEVLRGIFFKEVQVAVDCVLKP